MELLKAIVFILHFSFFGLTALFFLLKFHKKGRLKYIMLTAGALWILFGTIDFIIGLKNVLSVLA